MPEQQHSNGRDKRGAGDLWLVGCSNCDGLWIADAASATTDCPRCRTTYRTKSLRKFAEGDQHALVEKRTAILSSRSDPRSRDQYHTAVEVALDDYDSLEEAALASFFDDEDALRRVGAHSDADEIYGADVDDTDDTAEPSSGEPGSGDVHPTLDPLETPLPLASTAGIRRIPPEADGQLDLNTDVVRSGTSPRITDWTPALLEDLLPTFAAAVAQWVTDHDDLTLVNDDRLAIRKALLEELGVDLESDAIDAGDDTRAEVIDWVRELVDWTFAATFDGAGIDDAPRALTQIGTGRGLVNAGRDALRHGPAALLDALDVTPQVALKLDGGAWLGTRRGTRERSLDALDALADALDLRIMFSSPRLENVLLEQHADWSERHLSLTQGNETTHPSAAATDEDSTDATLAAEAWDLIRGREWGGTGYTRILGNLTAAGATRSDLATDANVALSEGSIYSYVDELADADLVTIDDSSRPHKVRLSTLGAAIAPYVDEDGSVQNPAQRVLLASPKRDTRECVPQHRQDPAREPPADGRRDRDRVSAAESFLATTGDADEDGYSRFLGRYSAGNAEREIQPSTLHHQLLAGRRSDGISVVEDSHLQKFEDGRVSYLSGGPAFDDHVLLVAEWGNPTGTMARLVDSLLDSPAWSKILRRSRLGGDLGDLWNGAEAFDEAVAELAKFGAQMGWLGSDEEDSYVDYRDRLQDVRTSVLERVGKFDTLDEDERGRLMSKLIGLFTTATTLYHAAGYDLTINIRIPDADQLRRDDGRYGRFLGFIRNVVAKQGVYYGPEGVHSIYRMQREQRPEKLKQRLGYEIDPSAPHADLTCSWVVAVDEAGEDVVDDVEDALQVEDTRVRERIQEGVEDAAVMDIPVVHGNGREATREIVEAFAMKKGFGPGSRQDLDRLVNVLHAALGTSDRPPSPYDVAAVMQSLESRDRGDDQLDIGAVATGVATLPANRIMPSLFEDERPKLSMQKMLRALLASDEALDRQDLIEISSRNSVDRYLQRLRALDIVERVGSGEYRAFLEPWWVPGNGENSPYSEAYDGEIAATGWGSGSWDEVLLGAAHELDEDTATEESIEAFTTPVEFDQVFETHPTLRQYEHILRVYFGNLDGADPPAGLARIGSPPPGAEPQQQRLTAAPSAD